MQEIIELRRQGLTISAISELTGSDRKTVRKYLAQPEGAPVYGPREVQPSKLEVFKPYLEERLQAGVWNAVVLLSELRTRGYAGGYTILKDWLQPQRESARTVAVRRFETPPGKQAQVDWGHLGTLEMDGQEYKLWGFTFTLGYSRTMMAEAALDQKLGTLLRMHEEAFRQLGGVPEEILYDRMKTVWLGIDERGEIVWHPVFLDFARYWGFRPRLCRPYRAQTKGKVESGVKYVRRNFLCGLQGRERAASPTSTRNCARGPGAWPTSVCTARRTSRWRCAGTWSSAVCIRWRGARRIPTSTMSCARWRATPMSPGAGAATRCPGPTRAGRCGCGNAARRWKCITDRSALPCTSVPNAGTWW